MATLVGRQKIPPAIKDVDEILTAELLETAAGVIEIVSKYVRNPNRLRLETWPFHFIRRYLLSESDRLQSGLD